MLESIQIHLVASASAVEALSLCPILLQRSIKATWFVYTLIISKHREEANAEEAHIQQQE